ncbi:hypothetical protein AXF42_Ash021570 [Apostasia shenzhenica]|uniref:WD repeat-containing protein 75 second beta-propeller domain-containing protein n=1 Tax=Apostasia shenzhenica TaxID=1088818 RepID=A0A2H9ZYE1_9ASPA|nr:hypothetical protein AXF42_Ash021570 [Apostasia shenzhenica]
MKYYMLSMIASDAQISALAFHPGNSMAVTSSFGGDFKVWIHTLNNPLEGPVHQKSGWRCQSVGSYKKIPMTAAKFSADGSVLAVAAASVITLWDPDRNALIAVIGNTIDPINALAFIPKTEYVVSLSRGPKPQLAVWNLSNMSMHWSYKISAEGKLIPA